jgi:hypothetical protein
VRIGRNLVRGNLMNAVRISRQRIDLTLHYPIRVMTREAHLCARTIPYQKILGDLVDVLHMRIVAARALNVSTDQLHRSGRISGLALRCQ